MIPFKWESSVLLKLRYSMSNLVNGATVSVMWTSQWTRAGINCANTTWIRHCNQLFCASVLEVSSKKKITRNNERLERYQFIPLSWMATSVHCCYCLERKVNISEAMMHPTSLQTFYFCCNILSGRITIDRGKESHFMTHYEVSQHNIVHHYCLFCLHMVCYNSAPVWHFAIYGLRLS